MSGKVRFAETAGLAMKATSRWRGLQGDRATPFSVPLRLVHAEHAESREVEGARASEAACAPAAGAGSARVDLLGVSLECFGRSGARQYEGRVWRSVTSWDAPPACPDSRGHFYVLEAPN